MKATNSPPTLVSEQYKSFRLSAPAGSASRIRVAGASLVCGLCGLVLGYIISMLLAHYVFYTIKTIFFDESWVFASALVVALAFAVFPSATRIYHITRRDAARAAVFGLLAAFIVVVVVALLFPSVHQHSVEVQHVSADPYTFAGPLLFLIPFVGVTTTVVLLFHHKHEPTSGVA